MLTIKTLVMNMICENCYVVSDETREAVVIDCGAYSSRDEQQLASYIEKEGLQVKHHLCTHAHFDHTFGCGFMQRTYGTLPEFHGADEPLYRQMPEQTVAFLGRRYEGEMPADFHLLNEQEDISFGNHHLTIIHTPGHTPGGISFYCKEEGVLFSGDSLFHLSIGRTDLPGGNQCALIKSLTEKLLSLPPETVVYPGHGESTTIGTERNGNPYLV